MNQSMEHHPPAASLEKEAVRWDAARAAEIIQRLSSLPGAALPILHALQEAFGYIPAEAVPLVADALVLSRAEVVGILNFYHDFHQQPVGRHVVKVCRAEACQSMGCEDLVNHLQDRLGIGMGETAPDGSITLETVYCLGNCALSPAIMVGRTLHGRVSLERADRVLQDLEAPK